MRIAIVPPFNYTSTESVDCLSKGLKYRQIMGFAILFKYNV